MPKIPNVTGNSEKRAVNPLAKLVCNSVLRALNMIHRFAD